MHTPVVWASLKAFAHEDADIRKSVEIPLELADMKIEPETLAERIVRGKPDLVGFSHAILFSVEIGHDDHAAS